MSPLILPGRVSVRWFELIFVSLLALCSAGATPIRPRQNIVLLTLDTTRADHLGCYGFRGAQTPNLDRLAREGVRFESAFTAAPNTLPSHAVILTGSYPFRTGVRDNLLYKLPRSMPTLAAHLKENGYQTLAFVSAAVLDRVFGLDRGFDVYDDQLHDERGGALLYDERNAGAVNQAVIERLPRLTQPYFLWVHYYDPHFPYQAPAPFAQNPALQPYDAELSYVDFQIGNLLDSLREKKLLENTVVVVVADHGESLGEHHEQSHGIFIYDSVSRVPLIFWNVENIKPGTVVRGLARTVDITPTILDLLHAGNIAHTDGVSLAPGMISGNSRISEAYEETFLPQNHYGWSPLFGLRTPQWQFILAPTPELYRISSDPAQTTNVYTRNPTIAGKIEHKLRGYPFDTQNSSVPEISDELKERIASLGYVSSARVRQKKSGMDPKEGIFLLDKIDRASQFLAAGKQTEGIEALEDVLKRNPENVPARVTLARVYLNARNYSAAKLQLMDALQYSQIDSIHLDLALALVGLGQFNEAVEQYKQALLINPRQLSAYANWAELELDLKRDAEAADVLQRAASQDVHSVALTLLRGRVAAFQGRFDDAVAAFEQARQEDPQNEATALYLLAGAYLQSGKSGQGIATLKQLLAKNPDHPDALRILGDIYFDQGNAAAAKEYYEKLLRAAPGFPDAAAVRERLRLLSNQK